MKFNKIILTVLAFLFFSSVNSYALETKIVKACTYGFAYSWIDCDTGVQKKSEKGEIAESPLSVSKDGESVTVSAPADEGFYQIFLYLSHSSKPLYTTDFNPETGLITLKPYVTINGFTFNKQTIYFDSSKFNLQW